MAFFFKYKPQSDRVLIMDMVEAFRTASPDGVDIGGFAQMVQGAVKKLMGSGEARLIANSPEGTGSDARKTRSGISERTVRYYRSEGWIADPYRSKGRGARYHEIHFLQMLGAYKLRLKKTPELEIKKVAKMTFAECLRILTEEAVEPTCLPTVSGDSFSLLLVTERNNPESRRVAKAVRTMARRHCSSLIQVSVYDTEIDLTEAEGVGEKKRISLGEFNENMPDPEDGDGKIRNQIQEFRRLHRIDENVFVQIVTSRIHKFDWFADWGATNPRDGVLHLGDYELKFGVSKEAVTASYALLLAFCGELAGRGVSPYGLFHRDHSRGCLFDFCDENRDVVLKLLSGDICDECLDQLKLIFTRDLMRETASFLDGIRSRVRALRQFGPNPEEDLQKLLRLIFVHAVIEAKSPGRETVLSLPDEGGDLEEWVFKSGVGVSMGIARELEALKQLVGNRKGKCEADDIEWRRSRDAVLKALHRLHPNLQIVRIDSVRLESGKFIASGVSLRDGSANSWEIVLSGDLASVGITDTGTTYASIADGGAGLRFINLNTHLRVVGEHDTAQAVLHLPDGTLVDYTDGVPLRGCTAFS